jgi:hypothetical protein
MTDPICFQDLFATYYKCRKHDVPYPKGAECPKCNMEKMDIGMSCNTKSR